ncbi:Sfi1 spindle body protein-domain-containing protein [Xylogone sp. PMI_703]|nr:Sfi1 spindle body protein-domain-containing protein [Xylogone sp. PMI_703]
MPLNSGTQAPSPPRDIGRIFPGSQEPYYTNEDVAVLHDIIVHAQELLPNLPERERLPTNALFTAYYDILPKIGINADHDSRYARILFKVGGMRGPESLYEKFEEILSRMGIEIEFDHGEDEEGGDNLEGSYTSRSAVRPLNTHPRPAEAVDQVERPRRSSESSIWDLSNDAPANPGMRPRSGISMTDNIKLNQRDEGMLAQHRLINDPDEHFGEPAVATHAEEVSNSDGREGRRYLDAKERRRGRSTSSHANLRVRRRSYSRNTGIERVAGLLPASSGEYESQPDAIAAASNYKQLPVEQTQDVEQIEQNDQRDDLMQIILTRFSRNQSEYLVRRELQRWREKLRELERDNFNLELIASDQDKKVLLRQALETWHNQWRQQKQLNEIRRFFAHLERRAGRARNLFLLQKAFTHWVQSAIDEMQRTSAARRYIIRTRIFNAWKDITAVNELKVRRQVLKKFFGHWKRRSCIITANNELAKHSWEDNLVRKMYRQWTGTFLEQIAIGWQSEKAKQRAFLNWVTSQQKINRNKRVAIEAKQLQLLKKALRIWKLRGHEQNWRYKQAELLHTSTMCRGVFRKWRRETQFAPAQVVVDHDINTRLLKNTFNIWLHRSQQEVKAIKFDRMRILREAWISWSHQLRTRAFQLRIQNRLAVQILYKWVLVERMALVQRLQDQRRLRRCLHTWFNLSSELQERDIVAGNAAVYQAATHTKRLIMKHFASRLQQQQHLELIASERYPSQLLRHSVNAWSSLSRHHLQLQLWASDAAFYFRASKSLKTWRESTENARREKRKAAYSHIRRLNKLNMAKRIFFEWRQQTKHVTSLRDQARDMLNSRDTRTGMNIFERWRAYSAEIMEMEYSYQESLLRRYFLIWRNRSSQLYAMYSEADINFDELQESRYMKKWSLRSLQIRAQLAYASEVHDKNSKRMFRKMFTYWQQRTSQRRQLEQNGLGATVMPMGQSIIQGQPKAWSDFGDESETDRVDRKFEMTDIQTPIPGYLNTPSKRNERVLAAAARFSSTTPRVPLSAPMERQLRAQYSGGTLLFRKKLGTRMSNITEFPDIREVRAATDNGNMN